MLTSYATPLRLELGKSARLQGFILLVHGLVLLSLLLLPLPLADRLLLCAPVLPLYWYTRIRHQRYWHVTWNQQDWRLEAEHINCSAVLLGSSFLSPWLTILNFQCGDGRRRTVLVLPDAVDADAFRRLRVRLRVEGFKSQRASVQQRALKEIANERECFLGKAERKKHTNG